MTMPERRIDAETLRSFTQQAFERTGMSAEDAGIDGEPRSRLPNLMLFGYLIRVLEDRLLDDPTLHS